MNLAEIVKGAVTVEDVLRLLSIQPSSKKRIPCPIHHGEHNNFAYNDTYYVCFSCGARGDIFTLLHEIKGFDFKQALSFLNDQFRLSLPIDGVLSKTDMMKSAKEDFLRRKAQKERQNRLNVAEEHYWMTFQRIVELDRIIDGCRPKCADDEITDEFAQALKEREIVREELDNARIKWEWLV